MEIPLTLRFFIKVVSWVDSSNIYRTSEWTREPKNVAQMRDCQQLHWPRNDIPTFFKFLLNKVSRLDKKAPAHFYTILGVVICKNHVARPLHSFNKCRKSFKPGNKFDVKAQCATVIVNDVTSNSILDCELPKYRNFFSKMAKKKENNFAKKSPTLEKVKYIVLPVYL